VYRQPVVEAVLLACVVLQAASGLRSLWTGRQRHRGPLAWLNVWPFVLFFVPYYSLAVAALFVHAGIVVAGLIVATLMGKMIPVAIPVKYLVTFAVR